MMPDNLCPECHGRPEVQLVLRDRIVKECVDCGHRWNEERSPDVVGVGGWVGEKGYVGAQGRSPRSAALRHRYGRARTPRQLFDVWWREKDRWTIYATNLSRTKAEALAKRVTFWLAPKWGLPNVPTQVLPAGSPSP